MDSRSIPAPAGEPYAHAAAKSTVEVYPRACGGTDRARHMGLVRPGLSPRLRGNLRPAPLGTKPRGSIPAPAGEPLRVGCATMPTWVYPRACGGTVCRLASKTSPRRSIPAPAGEPTPTFP